MIGQNILISSFPKISQKASDEKHLKRLIHDSITIRNPILDDSVSSIDLSRNVPNRYHENENPPVSQGLFSQGNVAPKISDPPTMDDNEVLSELTISNDADLLMKAQLNQWSGVGTEFDPIVIENYNFTGGSPNVRLSITDVHLYFVILNCMFENAANLTIFHNVSNAILKGNIFSSASDFGLYFDIESVYNIVVFNIFENTGSGGINVNDNGSTNHFKFNFWDDMSGSVDGGIYTNFYYTDGSGGSYDEAPRKFRQYWNHPELTFGSEAFFKSQAREYGILGNGTRTNPFRIEYINFSKPSETPLVWLTDTDSHILIHNCSFFGGGFVDGIYLFNVSNVTIEDAEIINCIHGVYIEYDSSYIDISNVNVSHCTSKGINVANTNHTIFTDCFIEDTVEEGVSVSECLNLTFINCSVKNSTTNGLYIIDSNTITAIAFTVEQSGTESLYVNNLNNSIFTNINIDNSLGDGMYLQYSNNVNISTCNILSTHGFRSIWVRYSSKINLNDVEITGMQKQNGKCIQIQDSSYIMINNSALYNNTEPVYNSVSGISIDSSSYITVNNTDLYNNSGYGITCYRTDNSTADFTNIRGGYTGLKFYRGGNNNASNLIIHDFSNNGIDLEITSNNRISFSDISNCSDGIDLQDTDNNQIFNNHIHENIRGIHCWGEGGALENKIFNNNITSNMNEGIFIDLGDDNVFTSNRISNNGIGVNLASFVSNNSFTGNYFTNNSAWDNGTDNKWNNATHGNYWSDYEGEDLIEPYGIGDTPHPILGTAGAMDNFPLLEIIPSGQNLFIELLSPENGSIINSDVYISININATAILFNWDSETNSTQNISEPTIFITPLADGIHSLEIYISNDTGHWLYLYLEFIVDNIDPIIESYGLDNDTEVGTETWIPFFVNDTHYEMFWYYWVDAENQTSETLYTTIPGTMAPSTLGKWELHVFANDTAGNVAEITLNLQILQAVPINLFYPIGGESVTGFCYIMWVCNESLQIDLSYSPDGGVTWINIANDITATSYLWDTSTIANGTGYRVRLVSTTPGKPGEDHSTNNFTIQNFPLPPGMAIYSLPDITIQIVLSESTDVSIERMFNVSLEMQTDLDFFYETGLFINITLENPDALEYMNISFSYADIEDKLIANNINISSLAVYYWNEDTRQWEPADEIYIDLDKKVVTGYFEHVTVIGVLGRSKASDRGGNPFLILFLAGIIFLAAAGGTFLIFDYRMKTSKGESSLIDKLRKLIVEQIKKKEKSD